MVIFRRKGVGTCLYNKLSFKENKFYGFLLPSISNSIHIFNWCIWDSYIHKTGVSSRGGRGKDFRGLEIRAWSLLLCIAIWWGCSVSFQCDKIYWILSNTQQERQIAGGERIRGRSVAWYKKMDFRLIIRTTCETLVTSFQSEVKMSITVWKNWNRWIIKIFALCQIVIQ